MNLPQSNKSNNANQLTIGLLIIYLIALFWILLFKLGVRFSYVESRTVNFIPFRDFWTLNGKIDFPESIMNIVIFVPLGIYLAILMKSWNFGKNLFSFFGISLMIETIQFIFKLGSFDVTDLVTNTLGGIIGWMLLKAIEIAFKSSIKAQRIINVIAAIATVVMIGFLILLKTNNLGIRYQ
jgi:glycopeptide antibiotics resistance protein